MPKGYTIKRYNKAVTKAYEEYKREQEKLIGPVVSKKYFRENIFSIPKPKVKRVFKKNLEKAYLEYTKKAAQYGINPMSKADFKKTIYKEYKLRKTKKAKSKNINKLIGKKAIEKQLKDLDPYERYKVMMKKGIKLGYIKATELDSRESIETQLMSGMTIESIVKEAYFINPNATKQLLMEAKQVGIPLSLKDLLSGGEQYQKLKQHINEHGWKTLLSWSYEEGTTEASADDVDIER